jgi:hypothetical protein
MAPLKVTELLQAKMIHEFISYMKQLPIFKGAEFFK